MGASVSFYWAVGPCRRLVERTLVKMLKTLLTSDVLPPPLTNWIYAKAWRSKSLRRAVF